MNPLDTRFILLFAAVFLVGVMGAASAQSERGPDRRSEPDSVIVIGVGVGVFPEYIGAKNARVQPIPMVFIKQGPFYLDSVRGLGYRHETDTGLFFGQAFDWDPGRADHGSDWRPGADRLHGMGTVKGSLVTTAEVGYRFTCWLSVRAEGEFALTGRGRGNRYTFGLEGGLWGGDKNDVWYAIDTHFSDGRFAQSYFGVASDQSAASGFSRYRPDRGFYAYSASLNWEHRFTKHWSALISVNALNLASDAAKSPIVQETFNTFALGAVNYTF